MSELLLFLAKATAVLVAAYVATTSLRKSTAGARHIVWVATLAAMIALPLIARYGPLRLEVLPLGGAAGELIASAVGGPSQIVGIADPVTTERTDSRVGLGDAKQSLPAVSRRARATLPPLVVLWAAISAALFAWLLMGAMSVRRILRSGRKLTTPDWTTPLYEVADRLGLEELPRLVASERIEMAFACDPFHPTIVLPATAEHWTDARRRAVLLHELAHIRRRDLFGHTLGRVACALYWFHPLVWMAAKRLRAESERACDDLVLTCGARPSEYAQHLLDMVTSVRNYGAPVTALPMARKKEFEGRMLAILDPAICRAAPGRAQCALLVGTLAVLSLSIAAVAPARSAPRREPAAPAPMTANAGVDSAAPVELGNAQMRARGERPTERRADTTLSRLPAEAAQTIVRVDTPQAVKGDTGKIATLIRVLQTDTDAEVRRTAAWALNEARGDAVFRALADALKKDADAEVRETSAWALAGHGDAAIAPLADALRGDKNAEVRETAAWGLGTLEARGQANALIDALNDPSDQVRQTAVWALGTLGGKTAPAGLTAGLRDKNDEVRLATAWALGEFEDASTTNALIDAFTSETSGEVRRAELRALALMGKASRSVIDAAIASKDPELRRQGVAMLAGQNIDWPWPWPWPRPRPMP